MADKKSVLIVEDERSLRSIMKDNLEEAGYLVFEAKDGEEGLEVAGEKHPNMIIVDIVMPKMDGITMTKMIRHEEWGKTVPIIFSTNLSNPENIAEAFEQGTLSYMIKSDWKMADLVKKVREIIGD